MGHIFLKVPLIPTMPVFGHMFLRDGGRVIVFCLGGREKLGAKCRI